MVRLIFTVLCEFINMNSIAEEVQKTGELKLSSRTAKTKVLSHSVSLNMFRTNYRLRISH